MLYLEFYDRCPPYSYNVPAASRGGGFLHILNASHAAKIAKYLSTRGNADILRNRPLGEGRSYLPSFFSAVIFNTPFHFCQFATLLPQGGGWAKAREKWQMARGILYFFLYKMLAADLPLFSCRGVGYTV